MLLCSTWKKQAMQTTTLLRIYTLSSLIQPRINMLWKRFVFTSAILRGFWLAALIRPLSPCGVSYRFLMFFETYPQKHLVILQFWWTLFQKAADWCHFMQMDLDSPRNPRNTQTRVQESSSKRPSRAPTKCISAISPPLTFTTPPWELPSERVRKTTSSFMLEVIENS